MFGDNLILLHWNLHKADRLKQPEQSPLDGTDDNFQQSDRLTP